MGLDYEKTRIGYQEELDKLVRTQKMILADSP
jgi:hypothetical protein